MSRYIDADALKIPSEEMVARMIINFAPSIDIVRCKECKWYRADEYSGIYRCYRGLSEVTADDFCSYGEPKGEE